MRVRLGTSALTSLMTFGLAPPSNDSSFTLKIVFSFGLAAAAASSPSASSALAPAPAPAAGSAAPPVGKAISWMFRRDCACGLLEKGRIVGICFWGEGWVGGYSYLEECDEVCGLEERQR
jgi:hypothetical protein